MTLILSSSLMYMYIDINDLHDVIDELRSIDFTKWKELGLSLGLHHNTLEKIKESCRGNPRTCLLECMAAWLKGEDKVREKGGPSWSSLATALEEIGANDIVRHIRAKHCAIVRHNLMHDCMNIIFLFL